MRSVVLFLVLLLFPSASIGQELLQEFSRVPKLEENVEFWKSIFTRYGKHHAVFHHREYPGIVYSVVDFTAAAKTYSAANLERKKKKEIKRERKRIKQALEQLKAGKTPSDELGQHIAREFKARGMDNRGAYASALEQKAIRQQTGIRERFEEGLVRSGRFLGAIESIFAAAKLPIGLSRLPLVESSFNYKARSSVGAAGIWQFTRSTGRQYMRVNRSIDERLDPIIATRAAAKYLNHSYNRLRSWPLALTSYNHGLNGILRAVKRTGTRDFGIIAEKYQSRTFGFASKNFYPSFLAALEIDQTASLHFPNLVREKEWLFDEVRLPRSISLASLSAKTDIPKETILKYNLALLKPIRQGRVRIPAGKVLKVPEGKGPVIASALGGGKVLTLASGTKSYFRNKRPSGGGYYIVRRGDTLGGIAQRHGISTGELARMNGIRDASRIRIGKRLRVPGGGSSGERTQSTQIVRNSTRYKVQAGDTLGAIAKRHGVRLTELQKTNGIKNPSRIRVGMDIKIPSTAAKVAYRVQHGDTLIGIARQHGTSLSKLRQANPGVSDQLFPGQELVIP